MARHSTVSNSDWLQNRIVLRCTHHRQYHPFVHFHGMSGSSASAEISRNGGRRLGIRWKRALDSGVRYLAGEARAANKLLVER
jgi:hypothetical protein